MMESPTRRHVMSAGALAGVSLFALATGACADASAPTRPAPFALSDAQWRQRLTPMQYYVLRQQGTERPGSSPLTAEHRRGRFLCAGCGVPLFSSIAKYDSGTGWPSFTAPLRGAVGTSTDHALGYARTEVHCANCGGHLGHSFDDGPPPTGRRYCMNGAALRFVAA
jgi:peptide-methionine (R)-S-oxide reductase